MSISNDLSFGLEIELYVKPKMNSALMTALSSLGWRDNVHHNSPIQLLKQNLRAIIATIAQIFSKGLLPTRTSEGDYETWSVLEEPALSFRPPYWPVEIVTRVLHTDQDWPSELARAFQLLEEFFDIRLTEGCSTHVHVCPLANNNKYIPTDVLAMLKAIAIYGDAWTRILPPERKANEFAVSNVLESKDVSTSVSSRYQLVPSQGFRPLFEYFESKLRRANANSEIWKPRLLAELKGTKYVSWNFMNLVEPCGTIEFRSPPGVSNHRQAAHWAALTLGFAAAALVASFDNFAAITAPATVEDLEKFLTSGVRSLGPFTQQMYDPELIVEDRRRPPVLSKEQLRLIQREKEQFKDRPSPFVVKVGSDVYLPTKTQIKHIDMLPGELKTQFAGWQPSFGRQLVLSSKSEVDSYLSFVLAIHKTDRFSKRSEDLVIMSLDGDEG